MKRIWFFTGGKGSGKTTAACRFVRPSETSKAVVFDTEDSLSDIIRQNELNNVEFGAYIRAYDRFKTTDDLLDRIAKGQLPWVNPKQKSTLAEYWEWTIQKLSKVLGNNNYRYLIIDTIEPLEAAAFAWAESNKKLSGWTTMRFGKHEVEAVRPLLENTFEAFAQHGITDILITSHLKTPWHEYAPNKSKPLPGKVKPGGRLKVWSRISTAMFWLVRPATPPNTYGAPSAIVLKSRCGRDSITDDDEWQTQSLIPSRIPCFNWTEWKRYEREGYNPLGSKEGESLYDHEKAMLSEMLSDKEYELMITGAKIMLADANGSDVIVSATDLFSNDSNGVVEKNEMDVLSLADRLKAHHNRSES